MAACDSPRGRALIRKVVELEQRHITLTSELEAADAHFRSTKHEVARYEKTKQEVRERTAAAKREEEANRAEIQVVMETIRRERAVKDSVLQQNERLRKKIAQRKVDLQARRSLDKPEAGEGDHDAL
eukprot:TRINITY_DN57173_c0_g1_i1.p1 TRINITY_DN57173_c0_g1~~TRINITY_DN57173_c0_g1_i1.p1  ORF type:complete len:127 (+),score=40.95 TRINITY_DN57173_c0_g1_i1:78-458(+)